MKTDHPQHDELPGESNEARSGDDERPHLLVSGSRRRTQRRRYLYEIEFFDAGHTTSLQAAARPHAAAAELAEFGAELQDPMLDDAAMPGPRDPRLREIISAAASGWVIGQV